MDQLETLPLDAGGEANVLLKQEEFAEAAPAEEALPVGEPGDEYNDADYDEALDPDYAEEGAEEGAEEEEHEQMEDPIDDIEEEAPNLEDLELKDAVKTKEKEKQGSKLQEKDALDEALQVEASSVQDDAALPLWGALDLRHVFRSKKVLVFNAMEDITNDEYLARS